MSIKEQLPENRTSITILILVLLCAAGLAYSQGWFYWSAPDAEIQSNEVSANEMMDQDQANKVVTKSTEQTSEQASRASE